MKYLSSEELWNCGQSKGLSRGSGGELILPPEERKAVFISRLYDCGPEGAPWGHLKLKLAGDAVFVVRVLFLEEADKEGLEALEGLEASGKLRAQHRFLATRAQITASSAQLWLAGCPAARGRFLKFSVELHRGGSSREIAFEGYEISFPAESFTEYLPGIYQNNDSLDRYMAVFQTLYLDLEEETERVAQELDADECSAEGLARLASWLGFGAFAGLLQERQLRELVRKGARLGGRKGTPAYYEELYHILTGRNAVVFEEPEKRSCTLLIMEEDGEEDGRWAAVDFIRDNMPLGVKLQTAVLRRTDRIEPGCFLDYTAVISRTDCRLTEDGAVLETLQLM